MYLNIVLNKLKVLFCSDCLKYFLFESLLTVKRICRKQMTTNEKESIRHFRGIHRYSYHPFLNQRCNHHASTYQTIK